MEAAEQIFEVLGQMKGAAMKVGQVASFIDTGAFPPEFQERIQAKLAELRDAAPRVPFKRMRKVIEDDLGERLGDVFAEFDDEAVAAASIGQVYRAPAARRPRGRGQGPVPGRRPGGARRPAEPGPDHARREADGARHGRQGDDARDPRAPDRRARLRARGPAAPRLRALAGAATRSSTCRRWSPSCAREHVLVSEWVEGTGFEEVKRAGPAPRATASARSSSASSSARSTATATSPATRTPATTG